MGSEIQKDYLMHILLYSVDVLIVGPKVRVCVLIDTCVYVHYMHIIHSHVHVHVRVVYCILCIQYIM